MLPPHPRSKFHAALKKKMKSRVQTKKIELLIWLDYLLIMQRLASAAQDKAREQRSTSVSSQHIHSVVKSVLKSSKG